MSNPRNVGLGAVIVGALFLFGSCGNDDPPPAPRTPSYVYTPTTTTPPLRTVAPPATYDVGSADALEAEYTPAEDYDEPDVDVPHVKRDRNGRCRDSHGRFTHCP